jgi:D-amino-acid dehydrogenase
MRVLVLGAGVIGVATAWYLAEDGHEVTVLDRQPGPGLETSFANAGEVSPGASGPWGSPEIPRLLLRWLFMRHRPLIIRPRLDPAMLAWCLRLLRNCTAARFLVNKARMQPLADYSRDRLRALRAATGISYDERSRGTLELFRTAEAVDAAAAGAAILDHFGVRHELLDVAGVLRVEPGLAHVRQKLAGGLWLPDDETGDCHAFTQKLAALCRARGVTFEHGVNAQGLDIQGERVVAVATDRGRRAAEAYVVAMGAFSTLLLRRVGIRLPVYPVKGYSLTLQVADPSAAPESSVVDEAFKAAITRLGNRVRVAGLAELDGWDARLRPGPRRTLEHLLLDLFPRAGDVRTGTYWCGLRPMTPDSPPILGPTTFKNLHLNTGHGTLGWTMACGSGRVVADLVGGRTPEIDARELSLARYARSHLAA